MAEDNDLRHGLINRPEMFHEGEKWVVLPGRFPPYWFKALSRKQKKQHTDAWRAHRSLPWSRWDVFQFHQPAVTSAKNLALLLGETPPVIPELPIYDVRETALSAETIHAVPKADRGMAVKSAARAVVEGKIPNNEADVHRFLRREGWIS
ncbi:hypothetical protein C6I21_02635 [Alkalicoccus urumqiensis]|uniref:Uncharacterized protein n=1 Tax=Alkalicoccus urumqiensis TaxID=1548213 RepID=A0A2P6MKN5_ALKUR|nr:hypothetical protein C6I21_02635 [Alkalicoccus urumqiensis]